MTADVELLPLPGWAYDNMHLRLRATSLQNQLTVYARAVAGHNVAHATAAKDAEIEALRAEVAVVKGSLTTELRLARGERDRAMQACETIVGHLAKAEARAERLAEALRAFPAEPNPYTYRIAHAKASAALNPTAAQENGRD